MSAEVQEVVEIFAAQAQRALGHDRLSIYILTPDGSGLERFAIASSPPVEGDLDVHPIESVGIARALRENRPIVSADFGNDRRILGKSDAVIYAAGFRSLVTVPLRLHGRPFGLLNFVSRQIGFYQDSDVAVAQQIADQIAVFLWDLRLQNAVRESLRNRAAREERERLTLELHDTLAQSLAELCVRSGALADAIGGREGHEEARSLQALARETLDSIRLSLFDASPRDDGTEPLEAALSRIVERFEESAGVPAMLRAQGGTDGVVPEARAAVLRIAQEALANVRRHAGARGVTVTLSAGDELELAVRDDGRGFPATDGEGFGLRSMHRTARSAGGRLAVTSRPGGPTEVTLAIPSGPVRADAQAAPPVGLAPPSTVLRVVVADDHRLFAEGLTRLLEAEKDMRVVAQTGTVTETVATVEKLRPDVLVLDLVMPDGSGTEVIAAVSGAERAPVILVMSALTQEVNVAEALDAGARGFLSKSAEPHELAESIRAAVRGVRLVYGGSWEGGTRSRPRLTTRELTTLQLIASGRTNAEIAEQLHVATKTVERTVATVCTKLGARNRAHAAARAVAANMVEAGAPD
jgi:DNA-binding NarL/FixJ family response regulator/signal transduction histidine kinase